jgi:hypothetical protein
VAVAVGEVDVVDVVVELVEVAMQEQALETREATFPVQAAAAYVGIAVVAVMGCAVKVAQKD